MNLGPELGCLRSCGLNAASSRLAGWLGEVRMVRVSNVHEYSRGVACGASRRSQNLHGCFTRTTDLPLERMPNFDASTRSCARMVSVEIISARPLPSCLPSAGRVPLESLNPFFSAEQRLRAGVPCCGRVVYRTTQLCVCARQQRQQPSMMLAKASTATRTQGPSSVRYKTQGARSAKILRRVSA